MGEIKLIERYRRSKKGEVELVGKKSWESGGGIG